MDTVVGGMSTGCFGNRGVMAVVALAVLAAGVVSDVVNGSFWVRHALLASIVGSVVVVMLSVAVALRLIAFPAAFMCVIMSNLDVACDQPAEPARLTQPMPDLDALSFCAPSSTSGATIAPWL